MSQLLHQSAGSIDQGSLRLGIIVGARGQLESLCSRRQHRQEWRHVHQAGVESHLFGTGNTVPG